MEWLEKIIKKTVNGSMGKILHSKKIPLISTEFTYEEKEKILKITTTIMTKVMHITTFISIILIMYYFYGKLGIEKLGALLMTLIFIQLVYINKNLNTFLEKKP